MVKHNRFEGKNARISNSEAGVLFPMDKLADATYETQLAAYHLSTGAVKKLVQLRASYKERL